MPLLNEDLSVWEIAHRWNNLDPYKTHWFRLPQEVRDSLRIMMQCILDDHLKSSLFLENWKTDSKTKPEQHIQYHMNDILSCIWGHKYNRKLFKIVSIDRDYFRLWCEEYDIPLPEFWFPSDWKYFSRGISFFDPEDYIVNESSETNNSKLRTNQRATIACQQIAEQLWKENPTMTIADMVIHNMIQKYGGGNRYDEATVRKWVKAVAPKSVSNKRGRPSKDNK